MRVVELPQKKIIYTCRSYLLLGDWNKLSDVNTLIDPGTDGSVLEQIENISTGCGKVPVMQIILTHNHFDHAGGVEVFKRHYGAKVYAWCEGNGVDEVLHDGQIFKAGDDLLQVLHTPGHSSDSICLYNASQKILFSGDTQLSIRSSDGVFTAEYVETLEKLAALQIEKVFSGHDEPMISNVHETIEKSLSKARDVRPPSTVLH